MPWVPHPSRFWFTGRVGVSAPPSLLNYPYPSNSQSPNAPKKNAPRKSRTLHDSSLRPSPKKLRRRRQPHRRRPNRQQDQLHPRPRPQLPGPGKQSHPPRRNVRPTRRRPHAQPSQHHPLHHPPTLLHVHRRNNPIRYPQSSDRRHRQRLQQRNNPIHEDPRSRSNSPGPNKKPSRPSLHRTNHKIPQRKPEAMARRLGRRSKPRPKSVGRGFRPGAPCAVVALGVLDSTNEIFLKG